MIRNFNQEKRQRIVDDAKQMEGTINAISLKLAPKYGVTAGSMAAFLSSRIEPAKKKNPPLNYEEKDNIRKIADSLDGTMSEKAKQLVSITGRRYSNLYKVLSDQPLEAEKMFNHRIFYY